MLNQLDAEEDKTVLCLKLNGSCPFVNAQPNDEKSETAEILSIDLLEMASPMRFSSTNASGCQLPRV